ncbi:MAG: zinc ABC transporter substrate-binding protein, partial [Lentisphaeria bacterium]|nr:zinc ABC transporter substrate-binding protein [Lentisphaeria bacterium]
HDHDHDHGYGHDHLHGGTDPHVWLDADNLVRMAATVRDELASLDPAGKAQFEKNYAVFAGRIAQIDGAIAEKLAPFKGRALFVYHAAFGYFARRYGLKQTAVELGGREVSPSRLAGVIRKAREAGAKVIFVQPQFNPASCRALADAIGGRVAPLDPLAADVEKNLLTMADAVSSGFSGGGKK